MNIQCPHCREILDVPSEITEGQSVHCPYCSEKFAYVSQKACCPACGEELFLPDGVADGQHIRCPYCETKFTYQDAGCDYADENSCDDEADSCATKRMPRPNCGRSERLQQGGISRKQCKIAFLCSVALFVLGLIAIGVWIVQVPSYRERREIGTTIYKWFKKFSVLKGSFIDKWLQDGDAYYITGNDLVVFASGRRDDGGGWSVATLGDLISTFHTKDDAYDYPVVDFDRQYEVGMPVPQNQRWMFKETSQSIDMKRYRATGDIVEPEGGYVVEFRRPTVQERLRMFSPAIRTVVALLALFIVSVSVFIALCIVFKGASKTYKWVNT